MGVHDNLGNDLLQLAEDILAGKHGTGLNVDVEEIKIQFEESISEAEYYAEVGQEVGEFEE